jgi:ABC-2 type transport system ATP-binding protein
MTATETGLAIEITDLTKRFGRTLALDKLTFTIPQGVIAGFVGPNGSGKTTTMRVLATLLRQDSGSAKVFGYDTRSPAAARHVRHAIGFMPDYFGLYTDMTAGEYLDFFGAAYRIPAEQRPRLADDILALMNLTDKKDTLISGLSRGMQQKLSLGRALIHSPRLLLLDEPASGLDPRARIELMELLRELKKMGKTIFISSHILSELHNLCDTVVIIENGRTVYTGSIEEASDGVLEGRRFVELTVAGDPDAAAEILKTIAGVREIRRKERVLLVEHDPGVSSADLIEGCVRNGIRIEEARRGSANLEEIFMRMTSHEE